MSQEEKYFHIFSTSKKEGVFDAYYAVDNLGWSLRFVEKKEDGSIYHANKDVEVGKTFLPEASLYPIKETEGYETKEIDKPSFDTMWDKAIEFAKKNNLKQVSTGSIR